MTVKRGDIVVYHKQPKRPLKVISDVYIYQGKEVVTAKTMVKRNAEIGMYAVRALEPYIEIKKEEKC